MRSSTAAEAKTPLSTFTSRLTVTFADASPMANPSELFTSPNALLVLVVLTSEAPKLFDAGSAGGAAGGGAAGGGAAGRGAAGGEGGAL